MRASRDSSTSQPPEGALRLPATGARRLLPACPHLGSIDDPATAFAYASPGNKCYCRPSPSRRWPAPIDLQYQERICLTARYPVCPVFQEAQNEGQVTAPPPRRRLPAVTSIVPWARARFEPVLSRPWPRRLLITALFILLIATIGYSVESNLRARDVPVQNNGDGGASVTATLALTTRELPIIISVNTATPAPPTPTPSATSTAPAQLPQITASPTASPTPSPSPSPDPTATGSPTPEPSASPTAPPSAVTCGPPAGWVTYVVQAGENLFRIGLRHNTTVSSLMRANCLNSSYIFAGQRLFVPFQAPTSTANPIPATTETTAPTDSPADPPADTPLPPTNTAQPTPTIEPPTATPLPTPTPPSPTAPPTPTPTMPSPTASPPPLPTATPQDSATPTVDVTLATPVATRDTTSGSGADDL